MQCVPGPAQQRRGLIHAPTARSGEALGVRHPLRERGPIDPDPVHVGEGQAHGDGQGGR
jgi:hypothetical protein